FIEQPRVLDGDDCLSSEAPEKLDFPVVESSYLLPVDDYRANHFTVFEHRDHKERSHAADLRKSHGVLVGLVRSHMLPYVSNLDNLFGLSHSRYRTPSDQRLALAKLGKGARCIVLCHYTESVCFTKKQCSEVGLTQFRSVGQNGIEQAVQVA